MHYLTDQSVRKLKNTFWYWLGSNEPGCFPLLLSSIVNVPGSSSLRHLAHIHLAIGGADGKKKKKQLSVWLTVAGLYFSQKHAWPALSCSAWFTLFSTLYFHCHHKAASQTRIMLMFMNGVHNIWMGGVGRKQGEWENSNFPLKTALMKRDLAGRWRCWGSAAVCNTRPNPNQNLRSSGIQLTQCTS